MSVRYRDMKEAIGQNWYSIDPNLVQLMDRLIPRADRAWADEKLAGMGELIGDRIARNAELTDKDSAKLIRWDREGEEINHVVHPASSLETKRLLWKSDFIHLSESKEEIERGRPGLPTTHIGFFYLLCQCDSGMLCSVAMTSGVMRLIERYGDDSTKALFLGKLQTADFDRGWDGSMYLTERAGGSDLGATETVASKHGDGWRLNGLKWFCSNVDGDAIVTLARPEGAPDGIRGLGLFAVPRWLPDGKNNGVHIRRIKDKMGTRAVPTGEIDFVDAIAYPLASDGSPEDGRGINRMMEFVNQSRIAVAAMGAGIMRRVFLEAAIRAHQRHAFGSPLTRHAMVREQLLDLMCESEAAASLLFEAAALIPVDRTKPVGYDDKVARILVPLTKMRCTRGGVQSSSLALELFGGNGYIEDWPMARQYRDAQCHTIWEGTENVLSLDVLRTMAQDQAHTDLLERLQECVSGAIHPILSNVKQAVSDAIGMLTEDLMRVATAGKEGALLHARHLANEMADVVQCAFVLNEAQWELSNQGTAHKAVAAAWLTRSRFEPRGRWNKANEGIVTDLFEKLIRYDDISPEAAEKYV